ncbi:hypothetical protein V6N13_048121 [Hibiscus sabdariffa]|uniref:RNase H type-1 domain-containing protein n=1 Tax=Hibiscus sabdariffa TaxID=183260 RepID=A0ABR2F669_9ROSI
MGPTSTKIFAIKEAISLFSKSCWAKSNTLLIKTDNKLASEWIRNVSTIPHFIKNEIVEILNLCREIYWNISLVPRECTAVADSLSKAGIGRAQQLVWVLN